MLRGTRAKVVVLALAVLILAVEGYFLYKYYELYYGVGPTQSAASSTGSAAPEPSEQVQSGETEAGKTMLVHRATSDNIVNNSTYIDHPSINGNPEAIMLVTQTQRPGDAVTNSRPIGVWYDANRGGKWAIFNQDLAPMPEGAAFNIVVPQSSKDAAVHRATPANTTDNATYLDHPSANSNPGAVISVTPNWNPGGSDGTYNNHPVKLRYDAGREKWAILNQDLAQMPQNAAFNLFLSEDAAAEERGDGGSDS